MAGKQDMRTPQWLFELLQKRFAKFTLDAAASPHDAKCTKFYTKEDDGLAKPWHSKTFCNPPFKNFGDWIKKGYEESCLGSGKRAVVLVGPTGCSQSWFHKYARRGLILVPNKRINFCEPDGTPTTGADRDTMIYVFGRAFKNPSYERFQIFPLTVRR